MFLNNGDGCLNEYRKNKKSASGLLFLFMLEIVECLLHRLPKLLPKPARIEAEEFLVEHRNCALVINHIWSPLA